MLPKWVAQAAGLGKADGGTPEWASGSETAGLYGFVRILLGAVLIAAAGLKAYQLATEPTAETTLLTSRWFLISLVEFEFGFGLWLLGGFRPREARWGAVVCLAAFAAVSLYRAISGADSCGCFGKITINPWLTFAIDVGFLVALGASKPGGRSVEPRASNYPIRGAVCARNSGSRSAHAITVCLAAR